MNKLMQRAEKYTTEVYGRHKLLSKGGMTYNEHLLVAETIEEFKPLKILEVGVQLGCTSAFLLRYLDIAGHRDTKLHSVDIIGEYTDPKTGVHHRIGEEVVKKKVPQDNWTLITGSPASNIHDKLESEYDICIIDTTHVYPGEIIDFLSVLPLLKKNAIVFFHDVAMLRDGPYSDVTSMLFSAVPGQKKLPVSKFFAGGKPNIGRVILDENILERLLGVFNLLLVKWQLKYSFDYINYLHSFFSKFYDKECMRLFAIASYMNTGSDIKSLSFNNCKVCQESGSDTMITPDANRLCKRCGVSYSQRVLREFVNRILPVFEDKDVLINMDSRVIPASEVGKCNSISFLEDEVVRQHDICVLYINKNNVVLSEKLISNLDDILADSGILIVHVEDEVISESSEYSNIINLINCAEKYSQNQSRICYEMDFLEYRGETIYVIGKNLEEIDRLLEV